MRPIDADTLLKGKEDHEMISTHLIFNAPTLDVKPVIKGKWLTHPHSMIMRCSLCGNEETAKNVGTINTDKHFCSNCGADMRESEDKE